MVSGAPIEPEGGEPSQRRAEEAEGPNESKGGPVLEPGFLVGGNVVVVSGEASEPRKVLCLGEVLGRRRQLADQEVREDGSWGPAELPCKGFDGYVIRLEGEATIPQEEALPPQAPGDRVTIDFEARAGEALWFVVLDENEDILPQAEVDVRWMDERGRLIERTFHPNEKGYIRAHGMPPGVITPVARCEGYGTLVGNDEVIPLDEPVGLSLQVFPAGSFAGRCLHDAEPVADFDVAAFHPNRTLRPALTRVRGSADGSFMLDDLEQGPLVVVVVAPGLAPSEPYLTEIRGVVTTEPVDFDLRDTAIGRGRVVDAQTGEAVSHARIRPVVHWYGEPLLKDETPYAARADGGFEIAAFAHGEAKCSVEAPGYGPAEARALAGPDGSVDFGLIRLSAAQPLDVVLIADEGTDLSRYTLSVYGPVRIERRPFPPEGVLHLESVSAGPNTLSLVAPARHERRIEVNLIPGDDWTVEIPITGPPTLTVEVLAEPGGEIPRFTRLLLNYYDDQKRPVAHCHYLDERPARVTNVTGDRITAFVQAPDGSPLASRTIEMRGREEVDVTIQLGGFGATLRVVDGEGEPVPNVSAYLTSADGERDFFWQITDATGHCTLAGVPEEDVLVYLSHPERGTRPATPLRLRSDPNEVVELVLESEASLQVQLSYPTGPAAGVRAMLLDAAGRIVERDTLSNDEGLVSWPSLEPGTYLVRINEPAHWYLDGRVSTEDTHRPVPLRVYRHAMLELEVRNAEGVPVAGLPLELVSLDFSTSVTAWIADGRVLASDDALRTDAHGLLRLERLPEGSYEWSTRGPSGEEHRGTCAAASGPATRVGIRVP